MLLPCCSLLTGMLHGKLVAIKEYPRKKFMLESLELQSKMGAALTLEPVAYATPALWFCSELRGSAAFAYDPQDNIAEVMMRWAWEDFFLAYSSVIMLAAGVLL